MISKNLFSAIAYAYSGSPWILWALALSQAVVAMLFLFPERDAFPGSAWIGALSALLALFYCGGITYYLGHRSEFTTDRAKPVGSRRS